MTFTLAVLLSIPVLFGLIFLSLINREKFEILKIDEPENNSVSRKNTNYL